MTTVPMPDTREAAISLVTAALRGDVDSVRCAIDMCDVDEWVPMFHASLAWLRAMASRLRSPEGLMALDVRVAEISRNHPNRDMRLATRLILGHAQTCSPPKESITAAESFENFYSIGAHTFNAACCEADYRVTDIFVVVLAMWRSLLPEVDTDARPAMVCNVAGQLWGSGAGPAPPPIENLRTGPRIMKVDDSTPPRATMAAPLETRVRQWDDGPPPRPTIPAGAPVSLRGLAIRRLQERGIDSVYG
jgi:hypothetical protein